MPDIDLTLQQFAREDEEKHAKEEAEKLKIPYINLVGYPLAPEVLNIIPKEEAYAHSLVAYLRMGNTVRVVTNRPGSPDLNDYIEKLKQATQNEVVLSYCSETSIRYGLTLYQTLLPEIQKTDKVEVTSESQKSFEDQIQSFSDLKEKIAEVSTTELLDVLFAGAVKNDATDIHIEPEENDFRIRYRIDGVLQDVAKLPPEGFHAVISRIKYLSKLKLDVNNPQDGRFEVAVMDETMDIRVSTLPTSYGEAVVMRLLPKKKKFVDLETLGFNKGAMEVIKEAISKPQGLILNTGPTGSGKTTTLYAILQKLNEPGKKIITLENPIEYRIDGIEQIQIETGNTNAQMKDDQNRRDSNDTSEQRINRENTTFANALRACLRQDPDILMVGEIRDGETANTALQAAMTGHLVLSTLHTNNAPAALARLMEMGIPPYLLAGSINLIIAQRLVRKVCTNCQGKGCEVCHKSGFKGRIAIIEVLTPSREIDNLIQKQAALRDFEETAHKLGMKTMYEDGMEKVAAGLTTKEEIERVTKQ